MAKLGAVTFTSVTWTAGDILTEAKLDNMTANDQAYDSHTAQGLQLDNDKAFVGKTAGGVAEDMLFMNTDDEVVAGFNSVGWTHVDDSWAYASASTITVPSGAASRYQKGDKIRIKQGAGYKYFYIVSVADTVLTVTGGTDFTVANSAITDIYYSKAGNPHGFPQWFAYSPTYGGFSADPTTVARFRINGRSVLVNHRTTSNGTSNATNFTITTPVTSSTAIIYVANSWQGTDNGAYQNAVLSQITTGSPGIISLTRQGGSANWTNSGAKGANGYIEYEI